MKILVVGSGGREHALVWKISQSKRVKKIFAAPGNPGMRDLAEIVDIKAANIIELADFAKSEGIDLTVVGSEQPLALGIVDEFVHRNLRIFGPTQKAATIETSKAFAKEFMRKNNIPTADFSIFTSYGEALAFLAKAIFPLVVKADGLAAGKGVYICKSKDEAQVAIQEVMLEGKFGKSGDKIVVEEFLTGEEMSFMVVADGRRALPLVSSMDYKRALEGNRGPNTGGMGAISPAPQISRGLFITIMKTIIQPTLEGMRFESKEFKGLLYVGLMITRDGPRVLEYNARPGDPETQTVLMRLKGDLVDLMEASIDENLYDVAMEWEEKASGCVVLAAKGYPGKYESGKQIKGLERAKSLGVEIFHAGTALERNHLVTAGGRVLNICASAATLEEAMKRIYDAVSFVSYDNIFYRRDIGLEKK